MGQEVTVKTMKAPDTLRGRARQSRTMFIVMVLVAGLPALIEGFDTSLYAFGSPYILKDMHAHSLALLGLIGTAYALGIAVFSLIGGLLFDYFSVKWTVMIAVLIFAIFTLLTGYAPNVMSLFWMRLLVGFGEGMFQPAIITLLGDIFFETRGRGVSVFAVFFGAGVFFSPYVIAPFLPHVQIPFAISALLSVIVLGLFAWIIPPVYKTVTARRLQLGNIFNRNVLALSTSIFLFGISLFGFRSYFSDYLLFGLHLVKAQAATIASMEGLGGLLLAFPLGSLADKWGRKPVVSVASVLVMLGSLLVFSGSGQVGFLIFSTFLFGAGWGVYVDLVSALGQDSVSDVIAGTVTGWLLLIFNVGALLGGPLFGLLLHQGYQKAGLFGIGIPAVLAFVMTLATKPVRTSNILTD